MKAMYRHDVMLKVNRDRGVRKLEKQRDEADTRVRLAEDAARKLKSLISPERAAAIRFKRGMEARERDRPRYKSMPEHKLMAARVFHQLYLLTIRKRKRAIDVFREFDLDDSGTIDREEFAAGCKSLGMNLGKVAERDVFDAIDEDRSGELDYWEVEKAIKRSGKYPPPYPKAETTGVAVALDGHQDKEDNVVATHFTDMKEGFRAILKFKNKLARTRLVEKAKQAARMQALATGKGDSSSSSGEESGSEGRPRRSGKGGDENEDEAGDDYDDDEYENEFEDEGDGDAAVGDAAAEDDAAAADDDYSDDNYSDDDDGFEDESGSLSASFVSGGQQPRQKRKQQAGPTPAAAPTSSEGATKIAGADSDSDDDGGGAAYTLKDLAGWVNTDDPSHLLDHPQLARQLAAVPEAVRRVAAKLRNLMKRERLGIKTMFDCLDVSGNGKLEVHELHEGLMAYLDIDLSLGDLKEVLDHCDKEMDGSISFKEFENAFLWADMKRQARLVKRQNHADRRHIKKLKRQRVAHERFRAESRIYRVPDARPLPTKEEAATFPDGRPRKLPFWLRPRDSPHSRPWKRTIPLGGPLAEAGGEKAVGSGEGDPAETPPATTWEEREKQGRMRRHLARKRALNVKTPRIKTYPEKFPAWQEAEREKLRKAKADKDAKLLQRQLRLQQHTKKSGGLGSSAVSPQSRKHLQRRKKKTLPPEEGMPTVPPRITNRELNGEVRGGDGRSESLALPTGGEDQRQQRRQGGRQETKGANASVLRALARRRQRRSKHPATRPSGSSSPSRDTADVTALADAAAMISLSQSPAGRRMLDAVAQYSQPPVLYGAAPETLSGEHFTPTEKPHVGGMVIAKRDRLLLQQKQKGSSQPPPGRVGRRGGARRHGRNSNKKKRRGKGDTVLPPTPYGSSTLSSSTVNNSASSSSSAKAALVSALRAVATLEDKVQAQHMDKLAENLFNFRVVRVSVDEGKVAADKDAARPSSAYLGEDGVRSHMASWNPTLVGVQVSPADEDEEVKSYRSPYMTSSSSSSSLAKGGRGSKSKRRIGKIVNLARVPRKQLLKKRALRKRLRREIDALRRVHAIETNPFIQRVVAVLALPREIVLVTTCPQGGTLRQMLEEKKTQSARALGENPVRFYAAEILLAIEYIHKKGIVHRDIKLENVRLGTDGHIVLDGFGLALPDFAGIETEIVGTPQCMAPEMILGDGYGRAVDWWAFGVLVFEMLRGESPFNGDTPEELFRDITTGSGSRKNSSDNNEDEAVDGGGGGGLKPRTIPGRPSGGGGGGGGHPVPVRLGSRYSDPAQDLVEGLLCRKVSQRLGGTKRGGTFGLRFHAFFSNPTLPGDKDGQLAKLAALHTTKGKGSRAGASIGGTFTSATAANLGSGGSASGRMSYYPQPVEWAKLRQRAVPPPFVVSKRTRAHAATSAYGAAKELGWAGEEEKAVENKERETTVVEGKVGADANVMNSLPRPSSRGYSGNSSRGAGRAQEGGRSRRAGIRSAEAREKPATSKPQEEAGDDDSKAFGAEDDEDDEDNEDESSYDLDLDSAVFDEASRAAPGSFVPLAYPEPLRISTADASATVGFDPLRPDHGALSRVGTAMIAGSAQTGGRVRGEQATTVEMSRDIATAARPSTRERAIPFQMQLASLQLRKTAGHVREEQAAITYGEAVNELANLQQERLVEKELQSQALLEADVGVYLSVPDL